MPIPKNIPQTIDEYIALFPTDTQKLLQQMRSTIKSSAPMAEETISYAMPTFKLNGKNLVHFAAFKNHIGFYPTPSGIKHFEKELSIYKYSKGSIQFPLNQPFPLNLVTKIVKYRMRESNQLKNK